MKGIEVQPLPLTDLTVGPIKARTDDIGEAYGLAGVVILVAVVLRLVGKYL